MRDDGTYRSPKEIFFRAALYSVLIAAAVCFLIPLFVMLITSLKTMNDIRTGHLISWPREISLDAWKEAWGVVDTFYVQPDQISRSPPSGEFLPKGSFIISGKKNFIKNAKTELVIGLELVKIDRRAQENKEYFYPKILSGPKTAIITHRDEKYLIIKPSKTGLSSGKLAKKIKQYFIDNADNDKKKYVKLLSLDEIIINLPTGQSKISSEI